MSNAHDELVCRGAPSPLFFRLQAGEYYQPVNLRNRITMPVPITIYDALHWESGRGMWRFRQQLSKHLGVLGILAEHHRSSIATHFRNPVLQVVANEFLEPAVRCFLRPRISLYPFNVLPEYCPPLGGVRVLVICDLLFLTKINGDGFGPIYRRLKFQRSIRRADAVITISFSVASQLRDRLRTDQKLFVLPLTVGDAFLRSEVSTEVRKREMFTVFHLGGAYASKATELVVGGVATLVSKGKPVHLIIGAMWKSRSFVRELAARYQLPESHYSVLPRVSDEELRDTYRSANLHCMPSLGEGFGIPVIEAASQGTANLLSPLDVFREIMGENALYLADWTIEAVAAGIERAMSTDLDVLTENAKRRAMSFSFESIHQTYAVPAFTIIQGMLHQS